MATRECFRRRERGDRRQALRHLRHASGSLRALEARVRRADRDPHDGRRRGSRDPSRLQAQAQFVRSRRRHRACRCAATHSLRASRSAQRDRDERQTARVLLGREHLHARHVVACVESELLQVHERNAQRHRGLEPSFRTQVHRRVQRDDRRRRLRAGARVRRDPARRRPVRRREPARGARCSAFSPAPAD